LEEQAAAFDRVRQEAINAAKAIIAEQETYL
jgi:hypothetical protein